MYAQEVEQYTDELIQIRRHLHKHPELSFQETKTKAFIADYLEKLGVEVTRDVGGNGVIGKIYGKNPGPTVLLRADFDALPIHDEKEVAYKSTVDGVMHACGHDGHTAMLLITAKILKAHEADIHGTIILCHQPAEEQLPGGAKAMIDAGILEGVDYVFGTHTSSLLETGKIAFCHGAAYANSDTLKIHIQGQGGHGAEPHTTKDAIIAASQLITQYQTIISRSVDPIDTGVVTIGEFKSGNAFNVIADTAYLSGTVRTYDPSVKKRIKERLETINKGVETSFEVSIDMNYIDGYPVLINTKKETDWLIQLAETVVNKDQVEMFAPSLGGEDFSYFLQERPGCYFYTGVRNEEKHCHYPHHHPKFDLDEAGLVNGVKMFVTLIENIKTL